MSLKDQIQKDLIENMKAKNEAAVGAIRMLKTAIMKFETAGEAKTANDEEIIQLVNKEIKQRKDSIEQFEKGNRPELAAKEKAEMAFLEKYMPAQMNEDEIKAVIKEGMAATGASTKADLGKLMGAIMPKVKGKADGGLVNRLVQSMLA
ncbi:MAG: GatB/YqeY domain-containing protein [Candidatus Peregrinibacteria bacterium]|nr:GatB/YqeY domain-containing protein [Candidatus Peregrinibacteria bacterium]